MGLQVREGELADGATFLVAHIQRVGETLDGEVTDVALFVGELNRGAADVDVDVLLAGLKGGIGHVGFDHARETIDAFGYLAGTAGLGQRKRQLRAQLGVACLDVSAVHRVPVGLVLELHALREEQTGIPHRAVSVELQLDLTLNPLGQRIDLAVVIPQAELAIGARSQRKDCVAVGAGDHVDPGTVEIQSMVVTEKIFARKLETLHLEAQGVRSIHQGGAVETETSDL